MCPALATPCDCSREHSEWDKLFIMLENSQMREGMLLQATDDLLRGELQRLRAELGRLAGGLARPCPAEARLEGALDELLQASRDAGRRLARLEGAEAPGALLEELRRTQDELRALQGWAAGRWLPAGKHGAGTRRGSSAAETTTELCCCKPGHGHRAAREAEPALRIIPSLGRPEEGWGLAISQRPLTPYPARRCRGSIGRL